jgi:hypothetical protein
MTFWGLQLSFWEFPIRGRLQNLNFKFKRFKLSFSVDNMISNKKSCKQQSFISLKGYNFYLEYVSICVHLKKSHFKFWEILDVLFVDESNSNYKWFNYKVL